MKTNTHYRSILILATVGFSFLYPLICNTNIFAQGNTELEQAIPKTLEQSTPENTPETRGQNINIYPLDKIVELDKGQTTKYNLQISNNGDQEIKVSFSLIKLELDTLNNSTQDNQAKDDQSIRDYLKLSPDQTSWQRDLQISIGTESSVTAKNSEVEHTNTNSTTSSTTTFTTANKDNQTLTNNIKDISIKAKSKQTIPIQISTNNPTEPTFHIIGLKLYIANTTSSAGIKLEQEIISLLRINLFAPETEKYKVTVSNFRVTPCVIASQPNEFEITIKNTGKTFFTPRGSIYITSPYGKRLLPDFSLNLESVTLYPGQILQKKYSWSPNQELSFIERTGSFTITTEIFENLNQSDKKTFTQIFCALPIESILILGSLLVLSALTIKSLFRQNKVNS